MPSETTCADTAAAVPSFPTYFSVGTWRFWRRLALLLACWVAAHIYKMLCDIAAAVALAAERDRDAKKAAESEDSVAADAGMPSGSGQVGGAAHPSGLYSCAKAPSLRAGFSFPCVPSGTVDAEHAWAPIQADEFSVRTGPDYPRNGFKAPSAPAMLPK